MADKATMADLGAARESRRNPATNYDAARKLKAVRTKDEKGSPTDHDRVHDCPSCRCKD